MFNVRSCTHVLRTLNNVRKTGVLLNIHLPERAFNVRFEKNYFNARVVICKHKGLLNACFSYHTLNACIT